MNDRQLERIRSGHGFIAALDQSGGSAPKALLQYGLGADSYSDATQMDTLIHEMRRRIILSPSFTDERILGAILFAETLDRSVDGQSTAEYLWERKNIVPFVKIDHGLAPRIDGVQMMKPIRDLDTQLDHARSHGVFGTKMRSLIADSNPLAIESLVDQQFAVATEVLANGLVPILEPEVAITSQFKVEAEHILHTMVLERLDDLNDEHQVMLKLTLPCIDDLYADLVSHPRILRAVALSGGHSRVEACERLARNTGVIASFSRALTEGLSIAQLESEFDHTLNTSVQQIFDASIT